MTCTTQRKKRLFYCTTLALALSLSLAAVRSVSLWFGASLEMHAMWNDFPWTQAANRFFSFTLYQYTTCLISSTLCTAVFFIYSEPGYKLIQTMRSHSIECDLFGSLLVFTRFIFFWVVVFPFDFTHFIELFYNINIICKSYVIVCGARSFNWNKN